MKKDRPGLLHGVAAVLISVAACSGAETTQPGSVSEPESTPPPRSGTYTRPFIWSPDAGIREIVLPSTTSGGQAADINNSGEVVGWYASRTAIHAFIWSQDDGMLDMHPRTEFAETHSRAMAINDVGQVVISLEIGWVGDATYIWDGRWIPISGDDFNTIPWGINNLGEIVGERFRDGGPFSDAFVWSLRSGLVALSSAYEYPRSRATGINNTGKIVGFDADGMSGSARSSTAVVWPRVAGGLSEVVGKGSEDGACARSWNPFEGPDNSCAALVAAVNDAGEITGSIRRQAFRRKPGGETVFLSSAAESSHATGINEKGDVVGYLISRSPMGVPYTTAFVWYSMGRIETLGTLRGTSSSVATGINDHGQVVGYMK